MHQPRKFATDARTQARLAMGMYSPEAKAARITGRAVKMLAIGRKTRGERLLAAAAKLPGSWAALSVSA